MEIKGRNRFEKETYKHLLKKKVNFDYESEKIAYVIAAHYIPDFIIRSPLGRTYIECKGYLRPEDKRKLIAVKKTNPWMDLRMLFYEDNKKNIRWAIRNGFKYAVGEIPDAWLQGL